MTHTTVLFDHGNLRAYTKCFVGSFNPLNSELADPGRFPKDSRDGNGFWVPFRVYGVHGEFSCLNDESCSWKSKELQVDVLIRYNFRAERGEVKIVREYRQRCPRHGGHLVFPRLDDEEGAMMVMKKTKNYIKMKFYGGPGYLSLTNNSRTRNSTGNSSISSGGDSTPTSSSTSTSYKQGGFLPDCMAAQGHLRPNTQRGRVNTNTSRGPRKKLPLYKPVLAHSRENCEACILRHCPYPSRNIPDYEFMVAGSQVNNRRNLTFITWNLLDINDIVLA